MKRFLKHRLGVLALGIVFIFFLAGIYAPFLASSKPIALVYDGKWFFPLFRYLFYSGFYTKKIDIFFNALMFVFPFIVLSLLIRSKKLFGFLCILTLALFYFCIAFPQKDPASHRLLIEKRQEQLKKDPSLRSWTFDLEYMPPYEKLNQVLRFRQQQEAHKKALTYFPNEKTGISTLWQMAKEHELAQDSPYIKDKNLWLEEQNKKITFDLMPFFRPYHWEDDVGGSQEMNQRLPWWELSRINRKDLAAALIFGIRISLVVGFLAVSLALIIGIPIGSLAGYYGGKVDIIVSRLIEIWESMPTFFMLLLVVAMMQSKSIFIVIAVVGIFGWTNFSSYIRGEFFKQKNLSYVEACHAQGFRDSYIIFSHILPNAIPPVLTLLPFAIMGAITSEAGLSFLGLGEEGSCSWGVLMDEGRSAFPGESYLLWPPAILLTILLVAIALVGDALRDAFDPKMQR